MVPLEDLPKALTYLISSFALLAVGIETKGRVLEQILQPKIA